MSRYRLYKNGIYGQQYKGLFVVKGEKGDFKVADKDGQIVKESILDYEDAKWEIDKMTATEEELAAIEEIYNMDMYMLTTIYSKLLDKDRENKLIEAEKAFLSWVERVRIRKDKDREM